MKAEKQEGDGHRGAHPQKASTLKPSFLGLVLSGKSEQTPLGSQAILVWWAWGMGWCWEKEWWYWSVQLVKQERHHRRGRGRERQRGPSPPASSDSILVTQLVLPCLSCLIFAGLHLCLSVYLPLPQPFLSISPDERDASGGPFCLRQCPWNLPSQPDCSLLIWKEEGSRRRDLEATLEGTVKGRKPPTPSPLSSSRSLWGPASEELMEKAASGRWGKREGADNSLSKPSPCSFLWWLSSLPLRHCGYPRASESQMFLGFFCLAEGRRISWKDSSFNLIPPQLLWLLPGIWGMGFSQS